MFSTIIAPIMALRKVPWAACNRRELGHLTSVTKSWLANNALKNVGHHELFRSKWLDYVT